MSANNCSSCGAGNNHFATKCDFCGNMLKQTPTDSISNEELVSLINLWIGRFIVDGRLTLEHNGKTKDYTTEEIEGVISQYTGILQMRALQDSRLTSLYIELFNKFKEKKKEKKKENRIIIIVAVIIIVVGYSVIYFGHLSK